MHSYLYHQSEWVEHKYSISPFTAEMSDKSETFFFAGSKLEHKQTIILLIFDFNNNYQYTAQSFRLYFSDDVQLFPPLLLFAVCSRNVLYAATDATHYSLVKLCKANDEKKVIFNHKKVGWINIKLVDGNLLLAQIARNPRWLMLIVSVFRFVCLICHSHVGILCPHFLHLF